MIKLDTKRKKTIAIVIGVLIGLGIIGAIFDDEDGGGSNIRSIKPSLENGILIVVPDVYIGMPFGELPDRWKPHFEEGPEHIRITETHMSRRIEYEGVEFHTVVVFNREASYQIATDEFYTFPLVVGISCTATNQVISSEILQKIIKNFNSVYGEAYQFNDIYYWQNDYFNISMEYFNVHNGADSLTINLSETRNN